MAKKPKKAASKGYAVIAVNTKTGDVFQLGSLFIPMTKKGAEEFARAFAPQPGRKIEVRPWENRKKKAAGV